MRSTAGVREDDRRRRIAEIMAVPFNAVVVLALWALIATGCSTRPAIAPAAAPAVPSFPAQLVDKGAPLAPIGNCVTRHTPPHGKPQARRFSLPPPLGRGYRENPTREPGTRLG